jgi:Na+/H+ antiporter NhaD/arsenite permease-like protein
LSSPYEKKKDVTALTIFIVSYIGIALGRIPGLALDRVGIAILGAIAMVVFKVLTPESAAAAINFPTICLLYALMIISAQLRLGGFYTFTAIRTARLVGSPKTFLLALMVVSAVLSAVLANDIICFAMTPLVIVPLRKNGRNAVPYLIGLAVSSNIGSAATLIGNPQNMLIGQVGKLDFTHFFLWALPPSILSLAAAYGLILWIYKGRLITHDAPFEQPAHMDWPPFDRWQTAKGLCAVTVLVFLFLTDLPRDISALGVSGILLCSRKMKTREILGLIDWQLITLFCALFVIIHGISQGSAPSLLVRDFAEKGAGLGNSTVLTAVSTVMSNIFSNVPAVMLLMKFIEPSHVVQWYTLAVSSTYAGNLILLGSIANLIVVEKAKEQGINLSFREHAVSGVPITFISLIILICWNIISN